MENYWKESVNELEDKTNPFGDNCAPNVIEMKVKIGTKIKNIIDYSVKHFVDNEKERHIVLTGVANASHKAISCAEILKRNFGKRLKTDLFQMNRIGYKSVEEIWRPIDPNLDVLKVKRNIPYISILLSKDPLDLNAPGVQYKDSIHTKEMIDKIDLNRNTNKWKQNRNKSKQKMSSKNSPKNSRQTDSESKDTTEANVCSHQS